LLAGYSEDSISFENIFVGIDDVEWLGEVSGNRSQIDIEESIHRRELRSPENSTGSKRAGR
jgi:hypothetical protein